MTFTPFAGTPGWQRQAATADAGFALQNATPTIISWTAPDDGQPHRVMFGGVLHVSSLETGGQIVIGWTGPWSGAQLHNSQLFAAGLAADTSGQYPGVTNLITVGPGTVVSITQASALTAGAATLWAEIWGS